MKRRHQIILIGSLFPLCWLAFMSVHEMGHVWGAIASGGTVSKVVVHPLSISRTDVSPNPVPLVTVWAGPIVGTVLPLIVWSLTRWFAIRIEYLARFFAGFCLVANGAYVAFGYLEPVGDAKVMINMGTPGWCLLLFGAVTVPVGFLLWNGTGPMFGLGDAGGRVDPRDALLCLVLLLFALTCTFFVSPRE